MGVDLTLLEVTSYACAHTILSMDRARELWSQFEAVEMTAGVPVPATFTSYMSRPEGGECRVCHTDSRYGVMKEDAYGSQIRMVYASDLLEGLKPDEDWTTRNRAIWAYLAALKPDTRIALYWH